MKNFPEINDYISESSTPMVYSSHYIKKSHPDSKVVFIGPCISKKLEALQENVKDYVDFVITFEELMGMFVAKELSLPKLKWTEKLSKLLLRGEATQLEEALLKLLRPEFMN